MLSLSFSICRLDGAVLRPVRATPECLHTAGTWWERGLGRLSKTLFTLCVTLGAHVHMCMLACGGSADAIHLSLGEVGSLIELAFTVSQQAFLSASRQYLVVCRMGSAGPIWTFMLSRQALDQLSCDPSPDSAFLK